MVLYLNKSALLGVPKALWYKNISSQSYEASMSVNDNSRVVNISNLLVITTLELKFMSVKCL